MNKWTEWDYRLFCNEYGDIGFIEVYYNLDGSIESITDDFITPVCKTINDLELDLEKMAEAFNKPMLQKGDLP